MMELKLDIIKLLINSELTPLEIAELLDVEEESVELIKIEITN